MGDLFHTLTEWYAAYGYPVLFFGVLLENMGFPLPGETAVLAAGFLASSAGGSRLEIGWVIVIAFLAAIWGDNTGYWLGRQVARPRLERREGFLFLTVKRLQLAENYFRRYGLWTVFFGRFITGIRVVVALAAGTCRMPWGRFLAAEVCGAACWATGISLLGFFFGKSWKLLEHWLGAGVWLVAGLLVLLFFGRNLIVRLLRRRAD